MYYILEKDQVSIIEFLIYYGREILLRLKKQEDCGYGSQLMNFPMAGLMVTMSSDWKILEEQSRRNPLRF